MQDTFPQAPKRNDSAALMQVVVTEMVKAIEFAWRVLEDPPKVSGRADFNHALIDVSSWSQTCLQIRTTARDSRSALSGASDSSTRSSVEGVMVDGQPLGNESVLFKQCGCMRD